MAETSMAEPKIVMELDGCQVLTGAISSGVAISFFGPGARTHSYSATFDRTNAKLLHEALGRALNTGEG